MFHRHVWFGQRVDLIRHKSRIVVSLEKIQWSGDTAPHSCVAVMRGSSVVAKPTVCVPCIVTYSLSDS